MFPSSNDDQRSELADASDQAQTPTTPASIPRLSLRRGLEGHPAYERPRDGLDSTELDESDTAGTQADQEGVGGLDTIDLLGENVRLFRQTRQLMTKVLNDSATPPNQKAQVANTLGSLLKTLSSTQTDLYNAERLKRLENVIVRILQDFPAELQERFLTAYEREVNVR